MKKPHKYWHNEDNVRKEASRYTYVSDFLKNSQGAVNGAKRLGIYKDLGLIKKKRKHIKSYWTEDKIREEASKFDKLSEFQKRLGGAYQAARKIGILDSLNLKRKTRWHEESIIEESRKYETFTEFQKGSAGAYDKALDLGIIDKIPITRKIVKKGTYNDVDNIIKASRECKTRTEFRLRFPGAHKKAITMGISEDLDFDLMGSLINRGVYGFFFEDGSVYIGLTCDFNKRKTAHLEYQKNSPIYKYINENNNVRYSFTILKNYCNVQEAVDTEIELINKYSLDENFTLLNKNTGGGLGGNRVFLK